MQSVVQTIVDCSNRLQSQEATIENQQETIRNKNLIIEEDTINFDSIYDAIVDKGQHPTKADRSTYAPAIEQIETGGTYQTKSVTPSTSAQVITPDAGYDAMDEVDVAAVTSNIDQNIQAGNIKDGVTILGVQGNYTGQSVNLQTKSVNGGVSTELVPTPVTYTPDQGYDGFSQFDVTPARLETEKYMTPSANEQTYDYANDLVYRGARKVRVAGDANLVAGNIKSGVSIFGVQGSLAPNLQTKAVSPSTSAQQVTPDSGYDGLNEVNIAAVTAAIDANIVAGNIKKDVTILGVQGILEGADTDIYGTAVNVLEGVNQAYNETLIEYDGRMFLVCANKYYEIDIENETMTLLYSSDVTRDDQSMHYKSQMVGNKLYFVFGDFSGFLNVYSFDFSTNTRTQLLHNPTGPSNAIESICSDGTYLYLADRTNLKIWKINISTLAISELAVLTRYYTSMVYRDGYIYGCLGDYVDKIDVSDGTITNLFNTSTDTSADCYRTLVADSDYIYLIGGKNSLHKILRFNGSTYEEFTVTNSYKDCKPLIYKGDLYIVNYGRGYNDNKLYKAGARFNKNDFIPASKTGVEIDVTGIKNIMLI